MHGWKNYPYVGYGHQLQPSEHFTADMTERQADSLLRTDLWKCFEHFKGYGKDALLLTLLAYNVGVERLLGYGKHPKRRLLQKIESGDRNFYREYISFCQYKGKVLRGLVKRRKMELILFLHPLITSSSIGYPYLFMTCHLVSCNIFRFNLGDSWHIICFIK